MNRGEREKESVPQKSGRTVHLYERKKEQKKLRLRSAFPLLGAHLLDRLALRNDATGGRRDNTFDLCLCPCKRGCMRCLPKSAPPLPPPSHAPNNSSSSLWMLGGSPIYWAECTERKEQKGGGGGGEWVSPNPILAFFISWAVAVYASRSGHRLINRELFRNWQGKGRELEE